jgi:hypothetical protein
MALQLTQGDCYKPATITTYIILLKIIFTTPRYRHETPLPPRNCALHLISSQLPYTTSFSSRLFRRDFDALEVLDWDGIVGNTHYSNGFQVML